MTQKLINRMQPSQGCTKHLGYDVQEYCNDCEELLCIKCLSSHSFHKKMRFEEYLGQHQKRTKALLHKVKRIRDRSLNLKVILENARDEWGRNKLKVHNAVKSFEAVNEGITRWKDNLIGYVEQRKSEEISKCETICNEILCNTFHGNIRAISFFVPRIKVDVQGKLNIGKKLRCELFPVGIQKALDGLTSSSIRRNSWYVNENASVNSERREYYLHSATDCDVSSKSTETAPDDETIYVDNIYDDVAASVNDIYEKLPLPPTESTSPPPLPPFHPAHEHATIIQSSPLPPSSHPAQEHLTIIQPKNTIIGTWFADKPDENVLFEHICTTPNGAIIVNDPRNSCIRIYTTAGKKYKKQFKEGKVPMAITYSKTHSAIVSALRTTTEPSKWYLNRTKYACDGKIGPDKDFKLSFISSSILGIASAPCTRTKDGICSVVTISEQNHGSIFFLNCKGLFIGKLQSEYAGRQPSGILYHDDCIVTSNEEGQLAKLSCQGNPLWDNQKAAREPNVLNQPKGITLLPDQNIAVCDTSNHCIAIFSKDGDLLSRFGSRGSDIGMFKFPRGIAVGLNNDLVVNDFGNNRIQVFEFGSVLATYTEPESESSYYELCRNMAYVDIH